ncbi:Unknown protein [Striga hermonthica]|uniref:Uncharacterized protein n=1 Tax=Striga hermonthica TaxID=68872 RepID=A0A9N7P3I0_STRHE|nr:Unknown protein [Striga hermonthica]
MFDKSQQASVRLLHRIGQWDVRNVQKWQVSQKARTSIKLKQNVVKKRQRETTVNEKGGTHTLEDTRAVTDDALPTIHTRTSSAIFVKAVSGLSEDQRHAVRDMGFGSLFDLTITATPTKMGYWLVDNFNHMDRKLQLTIEVTSRKKKKESGALKEWADVYNVSIATKITATKVLDMIQNCGRSDDWFKRHFVVLMITCLFESSQNGVANLRTVHLLDDLSNVSKMNWCAYLIRCQVGAKKSWTASQKSKNFTGPLLLLTLFYVDKVVLSIRTVPRSLPIFKSWNNGLLKARERDEVAADAFGRGYVDDDIHVSDVHHRADIHSGSPIGNDVNRASEDFVQEFASKARILATTGVEILQLVERVPKDLLGDENFMKMRGTAQKLLGVSNGDVKGKSSQQTPSCNDEPSIPRPTQLVDDAFWNDPKNLAALDAIIDAVAHRHHFKRIHHKGPSFSLGMGLTPDEENANAGRFDNVKKFTTDGPSNVDVPSTDRDAVVNESIADTIPDCVQGIGGDAIGDDPVVEVGRPKRSPKFSSMVRSPFHQRYMDVVKNLDSQEKTVVNWVLQKDNDDVIIYQTLYLDYAVKRDVVACLAPNTSIPEALIDLWARIMNISEKFGSRGSVACFFATTRPCNEVHCDIFMMYWKNTYDF